MVVGGCGTPGVPGTAAAAIGDDTSPTVVTVNTIPANKDITAPADIHWLGLTRPCECILWTTESPQASRSRQCDDPRWPPLAERRLVNLTDNELFRISRGAHRPQLSTPT